MKENYRIREVAIKKDGTDTWFYPERLEKVTITTGSLWWKKSEEKEEWCLFYDVHWSKQPVVLSEQRRQKEEDDSWLCRPRALGFRTYDEAKAIIIKHEAYLLSLYDDFYRQVCSKVNDIAKIHEVK